MDEVDDMDGMDKRQDGHALRGLEMIAEAVGDFLLVKPLKNV